MGQITPVILSGGNGTRLWPRSRVAKPKPFLPLVGNTTLFEEAIARCSDPALFAPPLVVTGQSHLPWVEQQLQGVTGAQVLVEPEGRNTAAAIALAALRLPPEAVMLVCPSDHHIANTHAFVRAAENAAELAAADWLVSFGIEPRTPETGFGYLHRGDPIAPAPEGSGATRVARFVEKPDLQRAREFLVSGEYAWNGGIFAFRAGFFLEELKRFRPELYAMLAEAVAKGHVDGNRFYPDRVLFCAIPRNAESVDYAVMENTSRAAMVPAAMGWSDIGNWDAIRAVRALDDEGNHITGTVELVDCQNVLVDTDGPRVSVIGLDDVIVVVDGDEVLVTSASGVQKVGKLKGAANQ